MAEYSRRFCLVILVVLGVTVSPFGFGGISLSQEKDSWENLEPGLDLGTFKAAIPSDYSDSLIRILRIDPEFFKFRLINASATPEKKRRSIRNWVDEFGLVAGINASMYQRDFITSVSLMKTENHVNNTWFSKDKTILAFDPVNTTLPPVRILDRDCDDFPKMRKLYKTLVQSIRMVSCRGENVWQRRPKKWSTSAIGRDGSGRMFFIHVRSPYPPHDLINMLLKLPIDLKRAMYVEGGPDAQLYIHSRKGEFEFLGSYSTGSHESDDNRIGWPVPNVVAIERLKSK